MRDLQRRTHGLLQQSWRESFTGTVQGDVQLVPEPAGAHQGGPDEPPEPAQDGPPLGHRLPGGEERPERLGLGRRHLQRRPVRQPHDHTLHSAAPHHAGQAAGRLVLAHPGAADQSEHRHQSVDRARLRRAHPRPPSAASRVPVSRRFGLSGHPAGGDGEHVQPVADPDDLGLRRHQPGPHLRRPVRDALPGTQRQRPGRR